MCTHTHTHTHTHMYTHILPESPESAFVHALTSAITVHKITEACYEGTLGAYCGPDNSLLGTVAPEGWRWGSSYDTDAGRRFAQQFLDDRHLSAQRNPNSTIQDLIRAQIHLHNNAAGRQVRHNNISAACIIINIKIQYSIST